MKDSETKKNLYDYDMIKSLVGSIIPEINSASPNTTKIKDNLEELKKGINNSKYLPEMIPIAKGVRKCIGETPELIFSFFGELFSKYPVNWEIISELLKAKEETIIEQTLQFISDHAKNSKIEIDEKTINFLCKELNRENSKLQKNDLALSVRDIVRYHKPAELKYSSQPLVYLFLKNKNIEIRLFAAKLLDLDNQPASIEISKSFLGSKIYNALSNYLTFTCASYADLLYIMPEYDNPSVLIENILSAEKDCGEEVIKELLSQLGWDRINYGLKIRKRKETTFPKSLPIYISEIENHFLSGVAEIKTGDDVYLVTAHGGNVLSKSSTVEGESPVARFRSYNLRHADVLKDILDVAPLTTSKIDRIINLLDKIVEDYIFLFTPFSEECKDLQGIYDNLKTKVKSETKTVDDQPQLSTDLTRLVQMFEEPKSVYDVTTIHGLKRYLHQRGLKLGFKLVDKGQTPNRTVDLALVVNNKISQIVKNISYADFEPSNSSSASLPYPIKVVVRGYLTQMLYGQDKFPVVKIFCYGNEIHYYVWFRNHPVFIRIDYSPPLQGGMIDLEYFGVSNYEIECHPNLNLDAIRKLFNKMEFDVQMNGTRIHARYDKERTVDFGQICSKAEYLFRMVPYMMDFDWYVGALDYSDEAKTKITEAWCESFLQWGALPTNYLLNANKTKIICYQENLLDTNSEMFWDGDENYNDKYISDLETSFLKSLTSAFNQLEIPTPKLTVHNKLRPFGQLYLEEQFLWSLREAFNIGEIIESSSFFINAHEDLFQRYHPTEIFAEVLSTQNKDLYSSASLAKLILPFERTLTFQTIGKIEHYYVQSTVLPLLGKNLNFYILRGPKGVIRLALYSYGNGIYKHRRFISDRWSRNWSFNVNKLSELLRHNNYVIPFSEPSQKDVEESIVIITQGLNKNIKSYGSSKIDGEKIINGLVASPGRSTGRALLSTDSRKPEDFENSILVAESISPEDNTYLYHSAGILSTGGGILSHAGLIAIQFNKPSMVIEGRWINNPGGAKSLIFTQLEFNEEHKKHSGLNITIRKNLHEKEYTLEDGDIVILDANKGEVKVLGQSRNALALYEGIKLYTNTIKSISSFESDDNLLLGRGKLIKAKHQIEKVIKQLKEPVLFNYAMQEILTGDLSSYNNSNERIDLLKTMIKNSDPGINSVQSIFNLVMELYNNYLSDYESALRSISDSYFLTEIVVLRLSVLKKHKLLENLIKFLASISFSTKALELKNIRQLNAASVDRLEYLFETRMIATEYTIRNTENVLESKHILRQLERLGQLLNLSDEKNEFIQDLSEQITKEELQIKEKLNQKNIITSDDGGLELVELVGGKASNLAEISRLGGNENVSPWFAVANHAFQYVLDSPLDASVSYIKEFPAGAKTLRNAIELVLEKPNLSNSEKSAYIVKMWETIKLPSLLLKEIGTAFEILLEKSEKHTPENEIFFAIRSSSLEEDAEIAARAGEFETFLFIKEFDQIINFLKKTWSGLWTERAIHNRTVLGSDYQYKGGVIIQKIVWARVSGVMQTINVANGDLREFVINAGLGLGEGIVSGKVASDQITVVKESNNEESPLNFSYITADKQEQMLYNEETGSGTKLCETLYHQRFRPALEYVELCELVKLASKLEAEYGYPLDIEYAIEGTKIWIMQVRPVATFLTAFNETVDKYPMLIKTSRKKNFKLEQPND